MWGVAREGTPSLPSSFTLPSTSGAELPSSFILPSPHVQGLLLTSSFTGYPPSVCVCVCRCVCVERELTFEIENSMIFLPPPRSSLHVRFGRGLYTLHNLSLLCSARALDCAMCAQRTPALSAAEARPLCVLPPWGRRRGHHWGNRCPRRHRGGGPRPPHSRPRRLSHRRCPRQRPHHLAPP